MRRSGRTATRAAPGAVLVVIAATLASFLSAWPAAAAADPKAGQALYLAKCGGCHSLDANRIGPLHRGVVGRRIASAPGYAYSAAIRKLTGVWTPARLDQWLEGPQKMAPGSKMYLAVPDMAQRADIIAWLAANPAKR